MELPITEPGKIVGCICGGDQESIPGHAAFGVSMNREPSGDPSQLLDKTLVVRRTLSAGAIGLEFFSTQGKDSI